MADITKKRARDTRGVVRDKPGKKEIKKAADAAENKAGKLVTGGLLRHILHTMRPGRRYPLCLDIGCGRGIGAEVIVRLFGAEKLIATDIDPEQIERAGKTLAPDLIGMVEFSVDDALPLSEPADKFDAVFSFGVIHHTEDWRRATREVARVLKSRGDFLFVEFLGHFVRSFTFVAHPRGGAFGFGEYYEDELKRSGIDLIAARHFNEITVLGVGRKK